MVKFITSNAVFTAANQGYGRSDGEMETDSFERAPRVNGDGIGRYGLPIHKRRALISSIDMFLKGASGEEKDQLSPGDLEA